MNYKEIPSPCFVLEEDKLRANLELIKSVQEEAGVKIILAFKGFAMWSVFPIIREYVNGATASSLNEAELCFQEMGTKAHVYSPVYIPEDFDGILKRASHITFNSLSEFHRYKKSVQDHPEAISIGLRVNPEYSPVKTDLYNPAVAGSRLGQLASALEDLPQEIEGLHFHTLCESDSNDLEETLKVFEQRFGHLLHRIKWVNMGGGHLMTREGYDKNHLIKLLSDFKKKYEVEIILEPGSAFAWETGFLTSRVLDIVSNADIHTAMLDVSFTAHMPDTLEMPYRPTVREASSIPIMGQFKYRLGGISCLSGDYMEAYSFEKELAVGDRLIFEDMIHYTMVKTTTFNGVKHPSIGMINSEGEFKLIKQFAYEDYKNRLS